MTKLTVQDFACIRKAELHASKFTLLIGPQASGKSVLAKLLHFFNEQLMRQFSAAQAATPMHAWLTQVESSFVKQFPESAWGHGAFLLHFEAGPYSITVRPDLTAPERVRAEVNGECVEDYLAILSAYGEVRKQIAEAGEEKAQGILTFDQYWPVMHRYQDDRKWKMGADYVGFQLFVPAGRSFFTTLGKTAIALGNSVVTDSVTQNFGRLITSLRDDSFPMSRRMSLKDSAKAILGGDVAIDGEREVLQSPDGRQIPLNLMSSGQQEFYPLAMALSYAGFFEDLYMYIEEPEAHLFPSAQSVLIDLLVDTIGDSDEDRRMMITTHSPYCLSKLNNLLKAGSLARERPDLEKWIDNVVPRQRWLTPDIFVAYAIIDGELVALLDDDGLIDSAYLDSISSTLAGEFGDLLELEYGGA